MTTQIQCPSCGAISPEGPPSVGSSIDCPRCGASFLASTGAVPAGATGAHYASGGQALGIFAAIALALVAAYYGARINPRKPDPDESMASTPRTFIPVLQPVPNGSSAPEDVERARREATDPAIRLALAEGGRVVFPNSPVTEDCRRLLDPVAARFGISRSQAASQILAIVERTEAEGDRFGPLQVLDAADLYMHSPRFRAGRNDFDSFVASFEEVRGASKDRARIPDRMIQLR